MQHPTISIGLHLTNSTIPTYATSGSSGFDFKAYIKETTVLGPNKRILIPTGLKFQIPIGYELQIRSKSGLALKNGIIVLNSPGTVDSDYRQDVGIILFNTSDENFIIEPNMKIAQGVICPIYQASFKILKEDDLNVTERIGGFGSTGTY
ncbi:MAG: dUTP diphosphatase [Candidatus Roizmanbacteria bacterium]